MGGKERSPRILFIVNPVSGFGLGWEVPYRLRRIAAYRELEYHVRFTEYAGHAREMAARAGEQGFTHVVAVGGDGTVNEVGTALMGTDVAMGIVSLGSGNGFARHLGFSLGMTRALKQLLSSRATWIDVVEMNGRFSLNVSGFGFDAAVAHYFSRLKIRGPVSYAAAAVDLWFRYRGERFRLEVDGKQWEEECFILSVANSSQYGNNASIAPRASLRDGLLDLCILKRPRWMQVPRFLYCFMHGKLGQLSYFREIQCREVVIEGDMRYAHLDGDPCRMASPVRAKVHPRVLKVLAPKLSREEEGGRCVGV